MNSTKAEIIARLQSDILRLQGFRKRVTTSGFDIVPGVIKNAFTGAVFPVGAVHEFSDANVEAAAATYGFVSGILASLMRSGGGACIWISSTRTVFPPALKSFGISPDKIIFIDAKKEKEMLWVMEEALKCSGLAAVVGEIPEVSFIASRRLQLAVEESCVTGFILRHNPRSLNTTACATRWKVTSLPSELPADIPGIGFPRWKVELLKVKNGRTGTWDIEFSGGKFRHISKITAIPFQHQKKTG